jgi:pimeloyl-ACP methyl ester carboxylesterase
MLRLTALLLGLLVAGCAARAVEAPPFRRAVTYAAGFAGPERAIGALVWLNGGVAPGQFTGPDTPDGQPAPDWLGLVAARGWDICRDNRTPGHDPLPEGEAGLIRGLEALRAAGYRRVVVAGFSRGAFIGLAALARPDLVEGVALLSPAAHGVRPERRAQAIADYRALLGSAKGPIRFALAQFDGDPFDPDPPLRGRLAAEAAAQAGMRFLHIDRPAGIEGHMGSYDAAFAARFAPGLVDFLLGPH